MNLLIIHHDPGIRTLIGNYIESPGDRCIYSHSAGDAVRILGEEPISLSLVIVTCPEDIDLLKEIAANYPGFDPLIASGNGFREIAGTLRKQSLKTFRLPQRFRHMLRNLDNLDSGSATGTIHTVSLN